VAFFLVSAEGLDERQAAGQYAQTVARPALMQKADKLDFLFKNLYETARTISLMPGVRQISGKNRGSADEDIVKQRRFSQEAYSTVQQLYNNLASNFAVSEIYCVLDGLDAGKGQVPFFMYDTLIVDKIASANAQDNAVANDPDIPDQSEAAEYAYFPQQLAAFKASQPRFDYQSLDQIPMAVSPVMRTCDNSQYLSIKNGDVKHANGMIISVPFYGISGNFLGLIAVIFRTDTLQALLLDIPFLVVTDQDKANAAA
jgi:methyl-accepting chemotaxis protein